MSIIIRLRSVLKTLSINTLLVIFLGFVILFYVFSLFIYCYVCNVVFVYYCILFVNNISTISTC